MKSKTANRLVRLLTTRDRGFLREHLGQPSPAAFAVTRTEGYFAIVDAWWEHDPDDPTAHWPPTIGVNCPADPRLSLIGRASVKTRLVNAHEPVALVLKVSAEPVAAAPILGEGQPAPPLGELRHWLLERGAITWPEVRSLSDAQRRALRLFHDQPVVEWVHHTLTPERMPIHPAGVHTNTLEALQRRGWLAYHRYSYSLTDKGRHGAAKLSARHKSKAARS